MEKLIEFCNLYYLFNCSDYALCNRIKQLEQIIDKKYEILKYVKIKGKINSHIGYSIQILIYEKEQIINSNKLLKAVTKQKCH